MVGDLQTPLAVSVSMFNLLLYSAFIQVEASRAVDGLPAELVASQIKAMNVCKATAQGCSERSTDRALSKSQSRLPLTQPAAARAWETTSADLPGTARRCTWIARPANPP